MAEAYLTQQLSLQSAALVEATQRLVQTPSPNPPGDTAAVARVAKELLSGIKNVEISEYETGPGIVNLVARVTSGTLGKRLVFNGHLDTYPVSGVLAENCDLWSGELVITLAGDEESGGVLGSGWLLNNVDIVRGDAVVNADVGSPRVVRFGEKGTFWVEITAEGVAGHSAHVHNGVNAIDRLRGALDAAQSIERIPFESPREVTEAIENAKHVSEAISGDGESRTLQTITFNVGVIQGGVSPNLIPSKASAKCDLRLPVGVSIADVEAHLREQLDPMEGISWTPLQRYEPTWTSPSERIVQSALKASKEVVGPTGLDSVVNMRVGGSDTRIFRLAGIPSVVIGCTPFGMGAEDEYVLVKELEQVAKIQALTAYDFLRK
ncbi:acetylornithine deacetylase [Penicillium chermesinum]|uniref:Acetylornithine deacetylase n=1 Tax=Penicillium chermesinum TaxID=63820 RepID=A0A9W9NTV4_9EURO|nr:acetylornithine deacetylase [Penicillium chermesinum]KAJ5226065.1 acetylornithine deacetylase [Penicillium chermesinum]